MRRIVPTLIWLAAVCNVPIVISGYMYPTTSKEAIKRPTGIGNDTYTLINKAFPSKQLFDFYGKQYKSIAAVSGYMYFTQ